jgi:hypothetical protein
MTIAAKFIPVGSMVYGPSGFFSLFLYVTLSSNFIRLIIYVKI